jgi:hypothetical protein
MEKGKMISMFNFKAKNENPKTNKLYEITYTTTLLAERRKSVVLASDELQAIRSFREIGCSQRFSDIVGIKIYKIEEGD